MTKWLPDSGTLARPAYRSLADHLGRAIEKGDLAPGERLPTHRDLAFDLGISVQTVSRAYVELIRRGLVVGEVGRGSFVRRSQPEQNWPFSKGIPASGLIDCSILQPVCGTVQENAFRKALAEASENAPQSVFFSFRKGVALSPYAANATAWLERCGLMTSPDLVHFTNGSTAAMTLAFIVASRPGDLVVTEALGHHTLKPLMHYLGLRLAGLDIDAEGIVPESLERMCSQESVKVLFLLPSGLNPACTTMSESRRASLVDLARKHDVLIIENDAWGPLQPDRPPPIAGLAPERTFYFTGFSKCLMPGLRTGYLVAPEQFTAATASRLQATEWMATPLMAHIAARWITDGTAVMLLDWQRRMLSERNRLATDLLAGIDVRSNEYGLHVWLPMADAASEADLVSHARSNGVALAPGSAFVISEANAPRGARICVGVAEKAALEKALQIVGRLISNRPEPVLEIL